jgi:hypothetical protein
LELGCEYVKDFVGCMQVGFVTVHSWLPTFATHSTGMKGAG